MPVVGFDSLAVHDHIPCAGVGFCPCSSIGRAFSFVVFCLVLRHVHCLDAGSIPVGDSGGVGVSEGLLFPCL